jgi:5S rRNA maturation endonuclease (ribonuclease M5)
MEFLKSDMRFTLVTIPEALAIKQLDGILAELDKNGFKTRKLLRRALNSLHLHICITDMFFLSNGEKRRSISNFNALKILYLKSKMPPILCTA